MVLDIQGVDVWITLVIQKLFIPTLLTMQTYQFFSVAETFLQMQSRSLRKNTLATGSVIYLD